MSLSQIKLMLERFHQAPEEEVLKWFGRLKGAVSSKAKEWVYVPGSRTDRVLLVAHADTVRHSTGGIKDTMWVGDTLMRPSGTAGGGWSGSGRSGGPLGADDRAGCAMLYSLWDGKHSLLITNGEERGCVGARAAVKQLGEELSKHQFAVEIDRRGDRHAVFYDIATKEFKDFMLMKMTAYDYEKVSWSEWSGSCTDVKVMCPDLQICGVNLSAGYWNEHSESEMLLLGAWLHTRTALRRLLAEEKIERFVLPKQKSFQTQSGNEYGDEYGEGWGYWAGRRADNTRSAAAGRAPAGGSSYIGEIEALTTACERAGSTVGTSRKDRKKLYRKIRKAWEDKKISGWQGFKLIDKLYPLPLTDGLRKEWVDMSGEFQQLSGSSSPAASSARTYAHERSQPAMAGSQPRPGVCRECHADTTKNEQHRTWCWTHRAAKLEADGVCSKCFTTNDKHTTYCPQHPDNLKKDPHNKCPKCGYQFVTVHISAAYKCPECHELLGGYKQTSCPKCAATVGHTISCPYWKEPEVAAKTEQTLTQIVKPDEDKDKLNTPIPTSIAHSKLPAYMCPKCHCKFAGTDVLPVVVQHIKSCHAEQQVPAPPRVALKCVVCNSDQHKSAECPTKKSVAVVPTRPHVKQIYENVYQCSHHCAGCKQPWHHDTLSEKGCLFPWNSACPNCDKTTIASMVVKYENAVQTYLKQNHTKIVEDAIRTAQQPDESGKGLN